MTSKESFFQFMKELEISTRKSKTLWHVFKNLPIKEGDNVVILGDAPELGSWLVKYGLESSMQVYADNFDKNYVPQKEMEFFNLFRQNKENHLPLCEVYNERFHEKHVILDSVKNANLVIFYNKDLAYVDNFLSEMLNQEIIANNFVFRKNRLYIKLQRHINIYKDLRKINDYLDLSASFSENYLASLPNDVRFSLFMNLLGTTLCDAVVDKKVYYKNSYPKKSSLYKDISFF